MRHSGSSKGSAAQPFYDLNQQRLHIGGSAHAVDAQNKIVAPFISEVTHKLVFGPEHDRAGGVAGVFSDVLSDWNGAIRKIHMIVIPRIVLQRSIADIDDIPGRFLDHDPLLGESG